MRLEVGVEPQQQVAVGPNAEVFLPLSVDYNAHFVSPQAQYSSRWQVIATQYIRVFLPLSADYSFCVTIGTTQLQVVGVSHKIRRAVSAHIRSLQYSFFVNRGTTEPLKDSFPVQVSSRRLQYSLVSIRKHGPGMLRIHNTRRCYPFNSLASTLIHQKTWDF